jgi:WD40 repeat protein
VDASGIHLFNTFSHDRRWLACNSGYRSSPGDGIVRIWDAETGVLQHALECYAKEVDYVNFSHDSQWLAAICNKAIVQIWDTETGAPHLTLDDNTSEVWCIEFSHNDQWLAGGLYNGKVWIRDANTGALQQPLKGHTETVRSLAFSHDDQRLASCSYDNTVRVWDSKTGALQQAVGIGTWLQQMSFSLDDLYLITKIGYITLNQLPSPAIQAPSWSGYGLGVDECWITWNGINVLWLPPEYRPVHSMVREQILVMVCPSGRVLSFEFKSNIRPTDGQTVTDIHCVTAHSLLYPPQDWEVIFPKEYSYALGNPSNVN